MLLTCVVVLHCAPLTCLSRGWFGIALCFTTCQGECVVAKRKRDGRGNDCVGDIILQNAKYYLMMSVVLLLLFVQALTFMQEQELGSLFSSPAIGSFASPRFQSMRSKNKGFRLSDDESSDDFDDDFDDDLDDDGSDGNDCDHRGNHDDDDGAADLVFGHRVSSQILQKKFGDSSPDDSFNRDNADGCFHEASQHDNGSDSPSWQQHQQQQLLLRFSCADSLDRECRHDLSAEL
jgi:hypothetical protein